MKPHSLNWLDTMIPVPNRLGERPARCRRNHRSTMFALASILTLIPVVVSCSSEEQPAVADEVVETPVVVVVEREVVREVEVPVEVAREVEAPAEVVVEKEVIKVVEVPVEVVKVVEVPAEIVVEKEVIKVVEVPVEVIKVVETPAEIVVEAITDREPEAPTGSELAQHIHDGETFTLVEYDEGLAVFSEYGSPVTNPRLAGDVLRSYSWREGLNGLDTHRLMDAREVIEGFDFRISGIRDTSSDAVAMLDHLETLSAEVPLLGTVSAMDVIAYSFSDAETAANSIRTLHSELRSLGRGSGELAEAIDSISWVDPSDVTAEDMESVFRAASDTAQDMGIRVGGAEDMISDVRDFAWVLEHTMRQASDTPVIGETLAESSETIGEFESILADLADAFRSAEHALDYLSSEFQAALELVEGVHKEYMDRWLQDPS